MILDRDAPLQTVLQSFGTIVQSGGQAVFICGEAGMGKSTLIEQVTGRLPRASNTVIGLCDPLNTPRPLGPVRDLAHALIGQASQTTDEALYFEDFLHHLQTSRTPLVLVLEDLHWADQKSLDWLQFVARRLSQLPVLLVGSYRDDEVGAHHPLRSALAAIPSARKTQITLSPLSLEAIQKLAGTTPINAEHVLQITGGNPFFVNELLSSHRDGSDTSSVPASVADTVNARLNRLDPALQRFLETVACWPGDIPYDLLTAMKLGDVAGYCDAAAGHHILIPTGANFRFRHELARLTAYDRMPPAQRRQAHQAFLSALLAQPEGTDRLDMIVYHAEGAHDVAAVLENAPRAATRAAALGAHREAASHLASAMAHLASQPTAFQAEICERWAYEAGLSLAIDEEVIAARERAVALWRQAGNTERVGENLRWLSRLHWYRGESEIAQRYIHEAIDVLDGEPLSPAKAKAFALRAQFHMLQDQMADAITWGQRALETAEQVDDMENCAHALNTLGSARMFRGDRGGETQLRQSLAISLDGAFHEQAARVYTNLSECLIEARDLDAAAELLEEGIAFDIAHDLDSWTFYLIGRKAHLCFEQDRYAEACAIARNVLEQPNQTLLMQMPARIILARAKLRLGEPGALNDLAKTMEQANQIDEPQYQVSLHIALIEAAVLDDAPTQAEASLNWLAALDSQQLSPRKYGEYLFWATLAGAGTPSSIPEIPAPFALMLEGNPEASAKAFREEHSRYLSAWALTATGKATDLAQADEAFATLNAIPAQKALRKRATDVDMPGMSRGPYKAASAHPYGLTRSEQKVLSLLADGKSNATMADELSRSRRTVENHVSSILSKLRCKNRLEVVLRIQSESWILPQ